MRTVALAIQTAISSSTLISSVTMEWIFSAKRI